MSKKGVKQVNVEMNSLGRKSTLNSPAFVGGSAETFPAQFGSDEEPEEAHYLTLSEIFFLEIPVVEIQIAVPN